MKENKNNTPFKAEDVNWEELAAIGILKNSSYICYNRKVSNRNRY